MTFKRVFFYKWNKLLVEVEMYKQTKVTFRWSWSWRPPLGPGWLCSNSPSSCWVPGTAGCFSPLLHTQHTRYIFISGNCFPNKYMMFHSFFSDVDWEGKNTKQHYESSHPSNLWTIWRHNELSSARPPAPGAECGADVSHASSCERVTGRMKRWACLAVNERICVGHFLHPAGAQSAHQTRATEQHSSLTRMWSNHPPTHTH